MHYNIETMHLADEYIKVEGWVLPDNINDNVNFKVITKNEIDIPFDIEKISRIDRLL